MHGRTPARKGETAMTESEEKRIQKLRAKISQMKNQEKTILARDKQRQRKEKTRRLIQNGALAEKYLKCEDISPQEFEKLLKRIVKLVEVRAMLELAQINKSSPEENNGKL